MKLSEDVPTGPDEPALRDDLAADLESFGVKRLEADWLADQVVVVSQECAGRTSPAEEPNPSAAAIARAGVTHVEPLLRRNLSRHAQIVGAGYRLASIRSYATADHVTESDEQRVFERFIRSACAITPPIKFDAGLEELLPQERRRDLDAIAFRVLFELERLDPTCVANLEEPESAHLHSHRPMFERECDEEAGRLAWSAMEPLGPRAQAAAREYPSPGLGQQELAKWIALIDERLARRPDDARLRGSLWIAILRAAPTSIDEPTRRRWLDLALKRTAFLRKDDQTCWELRGPPWEGYAEHDRDALDVIARLGGEWKSVKSALLLLRALRQPAVSMDLRYWLEPRDREGRYPDAPPVERLWIAESIATHLHQYASEKRHEDRDLLTFRGKFARFCLDRLKSKYDLAALPLSPDAAMVEHLRDWRRGYIRAVRELRVNPGGKGHHVLHWLSHNDPDESLRGEAATAYGEMIRGTELAPGASPRRALFAAYWHLRMAHVQALRGDRVDEVGAQRTRQKETRRVKELERNET